MMSRFNDFLSHSPVKQNKWDKIGTPMKKGRLSYLSHCPKLNFVFLTHTSLCTRTRT